MENKDKHGKPIYEPAYKRMLEIGEKLIANDYIETHNKSNFFVLTKEDYKVKIDMSDPYYFEITDEPNCFIMIFFKKDICLWKKLNYRNKLEIFLHNLKMKYVLSKKYGNIKIDPYNQFLKTENEIYLVL